jgi:hypothetical protein
MVLVPAFWQRLLQIFPFSSSSFILNNPMPSIKHLQTSTKHSESLSAAFGKSLSKQLGVWGD